MTGAQSSLTQTVDRMVNSQNGSAGKIIMVASGKGGVGKTWFSISLAHALAESGHKVLLFDGDLGLANVDIQLGLMPKHDLGTFLNGQATLEEIVIPYDIANFDIIAGRSGCGDLSSLSPRHLSFLQQALLTIAGNYDMVIMDLGAGVGGTVRTLSRIASECLIVVTDEPTSLTDAYAFMKVTHANQPDLTLTVIANQSENYQAGEDIYKTIKNACDNFLKFTPGFGGAIRRDVMVRDAIRNQSPLLTRHAQAVAAEDIRAISKKLFLRKKQISGHP